MRLCKEPSRRRTLLGENENLDGLGDGNLGDPALGVADLAHGLGVDGEVEGVEALVGPENEKALMGYSAINLREVAGQGLEEVEPARNLQATTKGGKREYQYHHLAACEGEKKEERGLEH